MWRKKKSMNRNVEQVLFLGSIDLVNLDVKSVDTFLFVGEVN